MLDVFNNLVKHLRISLDNKSSNESQRTLEKKFEEDLVNTIGLYLLLSLLRKQEVGVIFFK